MGRDSNFVCKTCKKIYYLGYGSCSSWLDTEARTIDEYNNHDGRDKALLKNENYSKCLREHDGHDFLTYSTDYYSEVNGNIECDPTGDILINNFSEYDYIDFDPNV